MALTQAGLQLQTTSFGNVIQQPQKHHLSPATCKCDPIHRTRSDAPRVRFNSKSFLSNHNSRLLRDCNSLKNARRSVGVRAAVTENETKDVESSNGPKERVVEIDPFEIPKTSPLQSAASLALTTVIGLLLFRSVRRRAQRATGVRLRSDGEEPTDLLAEAKANSLESIKPNVPSLPTSQNDEEQPKTPLSVLGGAVVAGAIAYGLWIFTTKVEGVFEIQKVSPNYQIRQISITVKTIVVGLAYLSTFVFAFNSIGLVLYAGQLALGLDDETTGKSNKDDVAQTKEESKADK